MARISPNLAFRIATGVARLGALYLATHAVGAFMGWQVMADAETPPKQADVEDEDEDEDDDDDDRSKPKIPTTKRQPDLRLSRITKYNVFCPTCAPEPIVPEELPVPDGVDLEDLEFPDAVRSQLPLALVATMEAEDPGISLATISHQDGNTGVYAEGEEVMSAVTLLAVDLGIVYLKTSTRVEYLQITDEMPPPAPPPTAKGEDDEDEDDKKPRSKYEIDGASDSISCQGMSCTVDRKFVNQLLANPAQLTRQGAARPYARDDLKGFRLSRVRNGTVPRLLGLRSGDVITGINGQPLDSLDGAMKLYTKLRSASHLNVDLVRNRSGERQQLRLDITIQ